MGRADRFAGVFVDDAREVAASSRTRILSAEYARRPAGAADRRRVRDRLLPRRHQAEPGGARPPDPLDPDDPHAGLPAADAAPGAALHPVLRPVCLPAPAAAGDRRGQGDLQRPARAVARRMRSGSSACRSPTTSGPILQGLDLEIAAGTITALVGPSGVGKSTWSTCWSGSIGPPPAPCGSMAWICRSSISPPGGRASATCRRRCCCSTTRSATTSRCSSPTSPRRP